MVPGRVGSNADRGVGGEVRRHRAEHRQGEAGQQVAGRRPQRDAQRAAAGAEVGEVERVQLRFSEGPHHEVSAFELDLDLILDGLRKLHDTG